MKGKEVVELNNEEKVVKMKYGKEIKYEWVLLGKG